MHKQVINDAMNLRSADFHRIQREIGIDYHQGLHESDRDFRVRVLTQAENEGKMRQLESLLTENY